jgi:zinc/manganese transport system permease protein
MTVLAEIGWQSNWVDILGTDFMRSAMIGGVLVALAAGLLGYFVVVRQHAFAAHALAHIGFPGATAAVLIGAPVTAGLAVFTLTGALAISLLGKRMAEREVATGTILAFATGLGVLFASMSTKNTSTVTSVLFGNLLAISDDQLWTFGLFTAGLAVLLVVVGRPLVYASVNPDVAEAKGVPVRFLGVVFMVALALVITMAVQVVGTLLLFALVVTPAATALALSARPSVVIALSTAIGVVCVLAGLVVSVMFNLPPSFAIVTLSFVIWLVTVVVRRDRHHAPPSSGCATAPMEEAEPAHPHHHHGAPPVVGADAALAPGPEPAT